MGAIPEKTPNRVGGYAFLKNTPGIFKFVPLPLEIPQKSFHPWNEILQNFVTPLPLEIPRSKTKQDPWKFHMKIEGNNS